LAASPIPKVPPPIRLKAFRYGAGSWDKERRFVARIEATPNGLDVRYVVTSLKAGAKHLYETLYCARGNAENFIKAHKSQLRRRPCCSWRGSCTPGAGT
jgi:hypothetical protein